MGNHHVCICRCVSKLVSELVGSLTWAAFQRSVVFYSGLSIHSCFTHSQRLNHTLGYRYDTGTIGGIIAMEDWLATFGTFQLNLPANLGVNNYYLPVNQKSLVVSYPNSFPFPLPRSVPMISSECLLCLTGIHSLCRNFLWRAFRVPDGRYSWS